MGNFNASRSTTISTEEIKAGVNALILPSFGKDFEGYNDAWCYSVSGMISSETNRNDLREAMEIVAEIYGSKLPGEGRTIHQEVFLKILKATARLCRASLGKNRCQLPNAGCSRSYCTWHSDLLRSGIETKLSNTIEAFTEWHQEIKSNAYYSDNKIYNLPSELLFSASQGKTKAWQLWQATKNNSQDVIETEEEHAF